MNNLLYTFISALWMFVTGFTALRYLQLFLDKKVHIRLLPLAMIQILWIGVDAWQKEQMPGYHPAEGIALCALMLLLFQSLWETLYQNRETGVLVLFPVAAMNLLALALGWFLDVGEIPRHPIFLAHIWVSLVAYCCFTLASLFAAMYLLLHKRLKNRQFDRVFRKIPSLHLLEHLIVPWIIGGFITLIFAYLLGITWTFRDSGVWNVVTRISSLWSLSTILCALILLVLQKLKILQGKLLAKWVIACFIVLILGNIFIHGY
jgi:HemX protein